MILPALTLLCLTLFCLAGCAVDNETTGAATQTREITDMAGRGRDVPVQKDRVVSAEPISAIYLYTLAPDKMIGWNYELNEVERSVILERYHSLPSFGMGDAINHEAVIAADPDVALFVAAINEGTIGLVDDLETRLGVPVLLVSNRLDETPDVYRFLGELLGETLHAGKLAEYAEKTFSDIAGITGITDTAGITETTGITDTSAGGFSGEKRVRVYYGNGEDSLSTAPAGSTHGRILDMVNAINVAELELGDGSRVQISPEQLLAWDPDVIIVNGEPRANMPGAAAAERILNDPLYASLSAVRNGLVFGAPNAPFSWIDRPQGPNRIVGIRWLAKLLYPDFFDYDVNDEVREFYSLFYHVELTDEWLRQIYTGEFR